MEARGAVNRLTAIALTANENEAAPMSEPNMKEGENDCMNKSKNK